MKKAIITMTLFIWGILNVNSQPMKTVRIVTGEWNPYVTQRIDGYGVITEIVTAVLNDMEIEPEYSFLYFYKCYDMAKENKYIGTFPFHIVEDRRDEMYFSDSLLTVKYVFFYNKELHQDYGNIKDPDNLKSKKVAVIQGYPKKYSYGTKFREMIDLMKVDTSKTEIEAFQLLKRGRVDLVPASERVGRDIVRGHFNQYKFGIIPNISSKETLHFIVSKTGTNSRNNEQFINKFNESLLTLQENGIYDEIKRRSYDPDLNLYKGEKQTGVVRLNAKDSFPLILGRKEQREKGKERNENPAYLIPNGTRAIILEWSEKYWKADKFEIHDQMFAETQVQLLEGPLKGDSLWVKNLHIEFE